MKKTTKKELEYLDFEISFFENILKDNPNYTDALIPLGDSYTKRGLYKKGLMVDLKLAKLLPSDSNVYYNLACSYSLLKKTDEAIHALENAIKLGYDDFEHIKKDPDLENLKNDNRYENLLLTIQIRRH